MEKLMLTEGLLPLQNALEKAIFFGLLMLL